MPPLITTEFYCNTMTYIETILGAIAGDLIATEAPLALSESLVRQQPQTPLSGS